MKSPITPHTVRAKTPPRSRIPVYGTYTPTSINKASDTLIQSQLETIIKGVSSLEQKYCGIYSQLSQNSSKNETLFKTLNENQELCKKEINELKINQSKISEKCHNDFKSLQDIYSELSQNSSKTETLLKSLNEGQGQCKKEINDMKVSQSKTTEKCQNDIKVLQEGHSKIRYDIQEVDDLRREVSALNDKYETCQRQLRAEITAISNSAYRSESPQISQENQKLKAENNKLQDLVRKYKSENELKSEIEFSH